TLGGETTVHHREGALGVGTVHRGGQREVCAQPVVAHAVIELHVHAQEALTGAQLVRGDDVGAHHLVAASAASALVADRAGREQVGGAHHDAGAHRPRLGHRHVDRIGTVDDRV